MVIENELRGLLIGIKTGVVTRMNELLVRKLDKRAILPSKRGEDSGYDITVIMPEDYDCIYPGERRIYGTGFATAFPAGYGFVVSNRGSVGSRGLMYGAHIISSGYRGEVFVNIHNVSSVPIIITDLPVLEVRDRVIDELHGRLTKGKEILDYDSIHDRVSLLEILDRCCSSTYSREESQPLFHTIKKSNPIVQALILPTMDFPVREVDDLPVSVCGTSTWGNTGSN